MVIKLKKKKKTASKEVFDNSKVRILKPAHFLECCYISYSLYNTENSSSSLKTINWKRSLLSWNMEIFNKILELISARGIVNKRLSACDSIGSE